MGKIIRRQEIEEMKKHDIASRKMNSETAQSYIDGIMAFKMFQNARKKALRKKRSTSKQKT